VASFSDDFNRVDSTDLGPSWVEVSGDWSIISGQLSPGSSGATIVLRAASAMASSDHSAQITIAATTAVSQGVWCRGDNTLTNGYLWRNDGTTWALFKVVSGAFTSLGTFSAAAAPGDVAKVQAVGSTIKGFIGGVERVSVTDTSVTSGLSVGLRVMSTSGLRFDNFAAADVSTGATLATAAATEAAQPLAGSKTVTISTADSVMAAWPLTGAKTAALGPAVETSTARPLVTAGLSDDIDVTVGAPYSPWAVGQSYVSAWNVQAPTTSDWEVGAPC
jgi:hypothetical protein